MPATKPTPTDAQALARALEFEKRQRRRVCSLTAPHPLGEQFRDDARPHAWELNQLAVSVADTDAPTLVAALDEAQDGLAHRRAVVHVAELGRRLAPAFTAMAGWTVAHHLYFVLRRPRDREPEPGLAREADAATLEAVERLQMAEDHPAAGDPEIVEQLLGMRSALRGDDGRGFVGAIEGVDACCASLYCFADEAQVEDVATLIEYRGRGLARAVCSLAIDSAIAGGASFVLIAADADDWPKRLYERLGFDPVGDVWAFTRPGPEHPAHV